MYKRIPRVMLILVLCFSFLATNYLVVLAQQQKQLDDNLVVKISHGPLPEGWFERPIDASEAQMGIIYWLQKYVGAEFSSITIIDPRLGSGYRAPLHSGYSLPKFLPNMDEDFNQFNSTMEVMEWYSNNGCAPSFSKESSIFENGYRAHRVSINCASCCGEVLNTITQLEYYWLDLGVQWLFIIVIRDIDCTSDQIPSMSVLKQESDQVLSDLRFDAVGLPMITPTPTICPPPPKCEMECDEPLFFYPCENFCTFFTRTSSLRYSREEMVENLGKGLQSYINEGNSISDGSSLTDIKDIAKTFSRVSLPTGKEADLQNLAREYAHAKQENDENFRLTPGDLLYLSLKVNKGNIRDALVTCHAALARDNKNAKKFIEEEDLLTHLRNQEGYADQDWTFVDKTGTTQTVNPRRDIGSDEQGPWYHLFGMAALEWVDQYGAASYYAAKLAVFHGESPELAGYDLSEIREKGFPYQGWVPKTAEFAIGLENALRSSPKHGAVPDPDKFCVNYAGMHAGLRLKQIYSEATKQKKGEVIHQEWLDRFNPYAPELKIYGIVVQKSPLAIRVEGKNGEWFSFNSITAQLAGNTPNFLIDFAPQDDGTWDFIGAPFFEVASIQIDAIGDGPATLAFYDHQQKSGNYYELQVQAGDHISMDGLSAVPLLNGSPMTAEPDDIKYEPDIFEDMPQQKSLVRPSLNSIPILAISAAAIILVGALLLWRGNKKSKGTTVHEKQIAYKPAGQKNTCPACGRAVRAGARFCRFCGAAIPTPQAKNICPSCGQTVRAGAAFCKNCGKKLH